MNKKLVLEEKDGGVLVGISQKDCDPVFSSFPGSLMDVLVEPVEGVNALVAFVTVAEAKWKDNPRATKYVAPAKPEVKKPKARSIPFSKSEKKAYGSDSATKKLKEGAPSPEAVSVPEEKEASPGTAQLPLLDEQEAQPRAEEVAAVEETKVEDAESKEAKPESKGFPALRTEEQKEAHKVYVADVAEAEKEADQTAEHPASPSDAEIDAHEAELAVSEKGYYIKDDSLPGRLDGPFADIQLAMDALSVPKDKRPTHKRYSRLSKVLQAKIIDRTA